MIESLFITKKFGTYADIFLMLGLAQITGDALSQTLYSTVRGILYMLSLIHCKCLELARVDLELWH